MKDMGSFAKHFLLSLFFYFVVTGSGTLNAATAKEKNWSFEFKALSVSEAVNNISKASGVKILLNGDADKGLLTKSYKGYTIDNLLIDIFSGENIAALFQYSGQNLAAVYIWILPKTENWNTNVNMLPISARNNQADTSPAVSPLQEYREIQEFIQESGIQPEIIVSADQKDKKKASEEIKKDYIYFPGVNREISSNSDTDDKSGVLSSPEEKRADNEDQESIDPPSPGPEKLRGLEPPPMPPGFITVNK